MSSITHKAFIAGVVLAFAACSGEKKNDPLAQDTSLTRDLELANRDTAAQPQLKDVATTPPPAVTPPPARSKPKPTPAPVVRPPKTPLPPPPPAPVAQAPQVTPSGNTVEQRSAGPGAAPEGHVGIVAAGTTIAVVAGQRICTNTNSIGDRFTATLSEPVTASNGVSIPAGATAVLEVTSLKRSEQDGDNMQLSIVLRSIAYGGKTYPVNGEITNAQTEKVRAKDNNDAAKVLGGAAIGAVLGRIFSGQSKTKGTVIGAAGGAAAGAVLANKTGKYDACIPSGGRITVRLNSAMQIQSIAADSSGHGI